MREMDENYAKNREYFNKKWEGYNSPLKDILK